MSVSSNSYLAPSGMDPGSHADEPVAPKGQSWLETSVQSIRALFYSHDSMASSDPSALIAKGEDKLAGYFSSVPFARKFFKPNEWQVSEAIGLFQRAAIAFRNNNQPMESGRTYERIAQMQTDDENEPLSAAVTLQDAHKAYYKVSPEDSVRCLQQAIQYFADAGSYSRAGVQQKILAEQIESEFGDLKRAADAHEMAAQYYDNDNSKLSFSHWERVAELSAMSGDYHRAIENYNIVIDAHGKGRRQDHRLPSHMMLAGLCHLTSLDTVATHRAIETYCNVLPSFPNIREGQLVINLVRAMEEGDDVGFKKILKDYRNRSGDIGFEPWKHNVGLKAYEAMLAQEEDFS